MIFRLAEAGYIIKLIKLTGENQKNSSKENITNPAVRRQIANSLHQDGQFHSPALPPQLSPFFELTI